MGYKRELLNLTTHQVIQNVKAKRRHSSTYYFTVHDFTVKDISGIGQKHNSLVRFQTVRFQNNLIKLYIGNINHSLETEEGIQKAEMKLDQVDNYL